MQEGKWGINAGHSGGSKFLLRAGPKDKVSRIVFKGIKERIKAKGE